MVCKIFFLLRIPGYSGKVAAKKKQKKEKKAIVKRYAFQTLKLSIVILGEEVLLLVMVMLYEVMLLGQFTVLITIIEF